MIKPTVGRVVWFYVYGQGQGHKGPLAALVTKVWSDRVVNLAIFDEDGSQWPQTSVRLVQENEETPGSNYCTWMPYQIGQAKKTEQLQKIVDGDPKGIPSK